MATRDVAATRAVTGRSGRPPTLNTLTADLMTHPRQLADGDHSVFVSGDDEETKQAVTELLTSFGHTGYAGHGSNL